MSRARGSREPVQPQAWRDFGNTYWYYYFFGAASANQASPAPGRRDLMIAPKPHSSAGQNPAPHAERSKARARSWRVGSRAGASSLPGSEASPARRSNRIPWLADIAAGCQRNGAAGRLRDCRASPRITSRWSFLPIWRR